MSESTPKKHNMSIPRPEHPRPQFVRDVWQSLNGPWDFEIDWADTGRERGLLDRPLEHEILVPFCPESSLSGIGRTDLMPAVWYRREVMIPSQWSGRRVLLHFQAVDYDATVWVNGQQVKRHRGGFTPFTCDLGDIVHPGEQVTVVVRARDDHRANKPRGKQCHTYNNYGCMYTRTTGIWQSVWMEAVPQQAYLDRPHITPDVASGCFTLVQPVRGERRGLSLHVRLLDEEGLVAKARIAADIDFSPTVILNIPKDRRRLWRPEDPYLYDLRITLEDDAGKVVDEATSYAGLRSISFDGKAVTLNGERLFQRLVLDQGYYPDGVMTAPDDAALQRDIELSQQAGFNGARLHQKVFEERYLYHADRLGYLVWGEFGDWFWPRHAPRNIETEHPDSAWVAQWLEVLHRDYSHPSIVGWCPLNESAAPLDEDRITKLDDTTLAMFLAAKAMDSTRPVLDASGYSHRVLETDIYDSHDYEQNPTAFAEHHAGLSKGKPHVNQHPNGQVWSVPYRGQPFFISEFGGIWWNPDADPNEDSWGYGDRPQSLETFYERFEGLCDVLRDDPNMFGYCYTQLTDVCQEQNGIYHFDRRAKFDVEHLRNIQQRPAAIEQDGESNDA